MYDQLRLDSGDLSSTHLTNKLAELNSSCGQAYNLWFVPHRDFWVTTVAYGDCYLKHSISESIICCEGMTKTKERYRKI